MYYADFKVVFYFVFRGPEENARLAEEVYQRLIAHKAENPTMGEVGNTLVFNHSISHILCCVISNLKKMVNKMFTLLFFPAKSSFSCKRINLCWDSAALQLNRLWIFLWFLGFISWWLFSHPLLDLSFFPFFSVFLSWHFLAPEMSLKRHVLLFPFCVYACQVLYHTMLYVFLFFLFSTSSCEAKL